MRKRCAVILAFFLAALCVRAQTSPPLRLIHTEFLPGYLGDFEHFAADLKGHRLFLIAEDHKTVEVLTSEQANEFIQLPALDSHTP